MLAQKKRWLKCSHLWKIFSVFLETPTPTLTNAHGPSLQPTACRSPTCSLMTTTTARSKQAHLRQGLNLLCLRRRRWIFAVFVAELTTYLQRSHAFPTQKKPFQFCGIFVCSCLSEFKELSKLGMTNLVKANNDSRVIMTRKLKSARLLCRYFYFYN